MHFITSFKRTSNRRARSRHRCLRRGEPVVVSQRCVSQRDIKNRSQLPPLTLISSNRRETMAKRNINCHVTIVVTTPIYETCNVSCILIDDDTSQQQQRRRFVWERERERERHHFRGGCIFVDPRALENKYLCNFLCTYCTASRCIIYSEICFYNNDNIIILR